MLASFDTTPNRRLFTGQYSDSETGLQYFGARYYDQTLGRFLTQDGFLGDANSPASQHRYQYALANPFRFIDPSGFQSVDAGLAFGPGNPCEGVVGACNPATKEVDDLVQQINAEFTEQANTRFEERMAKVREEDAIKDGELDAMRNDLYRLRTDQAVEESNRRSAEEFHPMNNLGKGDQLGFFRWVQEVEESAAANYPLAHRAMTFGSEYYPMHPLFSIRQWQSVQYTGASSGVLTDRLASGQDTTFSDWAGAAGDVATLVEPIAHVTGGVRQTLRSLKSVNPAIAKVQRVINYISRTQKVEILVRNADPITAAVTKLLTYMKIPAKPVVMKGKSFFGVTIGPKANRLGFGLYRSDVDLLAIRNAAGEVVDNARSVEIGKLINRLSGTDSVQHGSHATGWSYAGGGPDHLGTVAKYGHPGPATSFSPAGVGSVGASDVRKWLMSLPRDATVVRREMVGRWHKAWDTPRSSLLQRPAQAGRSLAQERSDESGK